MFYEIERRAKEKAKYLQKEYRKIYVLQSPLDTVERVQASLGLDTKPTAEQAYLVGFRHDETANEAVPVCVLDDVQVNKLYRYMTSSRSFSVTDTLVIYNGDKRAASRIIALTDFIV